MTAFKRTKSYAEVRNLKKWRPGRIAQLSLWLKHLETAFDETALAAQVLQSPKRKFSEFVPIVPDNQISAEAEYKEIRIRWQHPQGLRFFLFYEMQVSLFENFAQFDTFISQDPFYVFPDLVDGTTYYFRIRVINKDSLFGPWSKTQAVTTPIAQGFGFTDGTETDFKIAGVDNTLETVFEHDYNAIGGILYYGVDYYYESLYVAGNGPIQTDTEFQWYFDGVEVGRRFHLTSFSTVDTNIDVVTADLGSHPSDSLVLAFPFALARRGTFLQKPTTVSAGAHTIQLKALSNISNHPTPNDWIQNSSLNDIRYDGVGRIKFKNFFAYETLIR